jgi:hypothetical protein
MNDHQRQANRKRRALFFYAAIRANRPAVLFDEMAHNRQTQT